MSSCNVLDAITKEKIMNSKVKNEDSPEYVVEKSKSDDETIRLALNILYGRLQKVGAALSSPSSVKDYLRLQMATLEHEEFFIIYLNTQHQVIKCESLFRGTVNQTSVYPREVVKRALAVNSSAVMFAHNHPSGVAEPSQSDQLLTDALKQALNLVDVRVLDHFIVAGQDCMSFAERGLI
jgi:DNA repair protein RadC